MISLKQGYPKKQIKIKDRIIAKQVDTLLGDDPWQLPVPHNARYGTKEMQYYFSAITLRSISGEHANKLFARNYGFNLPDQQTVRVRVDKQGSVAIEDNNNQFTLKKKFVPALHYPNFMKRRLHKMMKRPKHTKQKRRNLKKRRKLQRERDVERPEGLYLAYDEHNIPYYGEQEVPLLRGEDLSSYLIKDRQKKSTKTFFSFVTVYSFEKGLREILSSLLMRRYKKKRR